MKKPIKKTKRPTVQLQRTLRIFTAAENAKFDKLPAAKRRVAASVVRSAPVRANVHQQRGRSKMARALVVALVVGLVGAAGCGGSGGGVSSTPQQELVGDWIIENDATGVGATLDISADGTYVFAILAITNTSPVAADVMAEKGNWSASPSTLTLTPTSWSCTGPDPATAESYSFNGGSLVLSDSAGITTFAPNNAPATAMLSITYGCFSAQPASSSNFVQQPLGPVWGYMNI
jgi:hypothetical protein